VLHFGNFSYFFTLMLDLMSYNNVVSFLIDFLSTMSLKQRFIGRQWLQLGM